MKRKPVDVFKYIDIPADGDPSPCWLWTGAINEKDQRPYFTVGGVKWLAYRVVYMLVHGMIPSGHVIRHKCDTPLCCNPYHLQTGTQSDNERDKYERERYGFPHVVIRTILELHERGVPQRQVAEMTTNMHGVIVTQQRVSDIVTGARRTETTKVEKRN